MIRLGIDLNNVLRNINASFYKEYCDAKARRYTITDERLENLDIYNDDTFFKFKSRKERLDFMFDASYNIFGCAPTMEVNLKSKFNFWLGKVVDYFEEDEIEVIALIPSEGGAALAASLVFLGKGFQFRHVIAPKDSKDCWNYCDAIITATPRIMDHCPADKAVVKIKRDFNTKQKADMEYKYFSDVLKDEEFLTKLVKKLNEKQNNISTVRWIKKLKKQLLNLKQKLISFVTRSSK